MRKHKLQEVYYVSGYWFTKLENAAAALKQCPESKIETFKG
jgi:hypothetical protein